MLNIELKIVVYADFRVAPNGIVNIDTRANDFLKRTARIHKQEMKDVRIFVKKTTAIAKEIEKQLFNDLNFLPNQINNSSIVPYLGKYKAVKIV